MLFNRLRVSMCRAYRRVVTPEILQPVFSYKNNIKHPALTRSWANIFFCLNRISACRLSIETLHFEKKTKKMGLKQQISVVRILLRRNKK